MVGDEVKQPLHGYRWRGWIETVARRRTVTLIAGNQIAHGDSRCQRSAEMFTEEDYDCAMQAQRLPAASSQEERMDGMFSESCQPTFHRCLLVHATRECRMSARTGHGVP